MNLFEAQEGKEYIIRSIQTDDEEMDAFLFSLGCYSGEPITVISRKRSVCVVAIKDGTLVSYELPWQAVAKALNQQLQTVNLADRTYAALGRELVDISADLENIETEQANVCLGQVVSYRPLEDGLTCRFGVVAEGEGVPLLSLYVAEIEGEVRYGSGVFALENLHLLSTK